MVSDDSRLYLAGGSVRGSVLAITADANHPEIAWQSNRSVPGCSSPLVLGGTLYTLSRSGIASALDANSGLAGWRGRLPGSDYYASPIAVGNLIFAIGGEGSVSVFTAGPRFQVLASYEAGEPVIASPAYVNGRLFLRGDRSVIAVDTLPATRVSQTR